MKICAQTRQEGGRVRCASPIIFLLPMVPCGSSAVTRVSLAFRARLCAKNEPATTQTLIVGHPSQHGGRNAKGNSRKRKPLLYSLTKTEYTSKMQLRPLLTNPSLDQFGEQDGAVVRALAFHQCGSGSIPGLDVICGLSLLLVLFSAPRGFSPGTPVFPSPQKPTFLNSNSIRNTRAFNT